jgi:hypothetical protein
MLRQILGRVTGSSRRAPAAHRPTSGRPSTGGAGADKDIERGARSLLRGLSKKR